VAKSRRWAGNPVGGGWKRASTVPAVRGEDRLVDFAEDLGRLLGTAQSKASTWLNQRQEITTQLTQIRDAANEYLQELSGRGATLAAAVSRGRKRGRPPGSKNRKAAAPSTQPARKRRKMSAAARKKISDAQKARWAKRKAAK
jgi:hypothetical protein